MHLVLVDDVRADVEDDQSSGSVKRLNRADVSVMCFAMGHDPYQQVHRSDQARTWHVVRCDTMLTTMD